jgi:hypothetical protein
VSSVLSLLDDREFESGLAKMREYALSHPDDRWMLEDKLTLTWGTKFEQPGERRDFRE